MAFMTEALLAELENESAGDLLAALYSLKAEPGIEHGIQLPQA